MIQPPPTSTLFPYTTLFRSTAKARVSGTCWMTRHALSEEPSPDGSQSRTATSGICESTSPTPEDRKSTRLNSSHTVISYAVFCLKKKKKKKKIKYNNDIERK